MILSSRPNQHRVTRGISATQSLMHFKLVEARFLLLLPVLHGLVSNDDIPPVVGSQQQGPSCIQATLHYGAAKPGGSSESTWLTAIHQAIRLHEPGTAGRSATADDTRWSSLSATLEVSGSYRLVLSLWTCLTLPFPTPPIPSHPLPLYFSMSAPIETISTMVAAMCGVHES